MAEQLLHIFPGSGGSSGGSLAGGYLLPRNSEVARSSACELEGRIRSDPFWGVLCLLWARGRQLWPVWPCECVSVEIINLEGEELVDDVDGAL